MQYKRVLIRNFQSIKELELVLDENRCYHFKGENNIGKSSLFKALSIIESNLHRGLDEYIRDYADSFFIEVEDFDNNVVSFSRGKEDYYIWSINGNSGRVDGTAGKVPPQVTEFFNFYKDMDKSKENVNIRLARSRLLFIDTTNGDNYYLLQKALGIEEGLSAIKLGESKKKVNKKAIDLAEAQILENQNDMENLSDYTLILDELSTYEKVIDTYFNNIELLSKVKDLQDTINQRESLLDSLAIEFDSEYVKELADTIKLLDEVLTLTERVQNAQKRISGYDAFINEFEVAEPIFKVWQHYVDSIPLITRTEELTKKVKQSELNIESYKNSILTYEALTLGEDMAIVQLLNETLTAFDKEKRQTEIVSEIDKQVHIEEDARKKFMVDNKFCPVVVSMIDQTCPFSNQTLEELLENK